MKSIFFRKCLGDTLPMEKKIELDLIGLYAYAEPSHARHRELWRGFLSYALPSIQLTDSNSVDRDLASAVVYNLEELTAPNHHKSQIVSMRHISMMLAKEIGIDPEFGLASFFEGVSSAKLHPNTKTISQKKPVSYQEDSMVTQWLARFARLQKEATFVNKVDEWKSLMLTNTL